MKTPLITPNLCWCCGEPLTQLQFLNEIPTCNDCLAVEREVEALKAMCAKPPVEGVDFVEMPLPSEALAV